MGNKVIHHADDQFYELLVDNQFAGLVVCGDVGCRYIITHTYIAEGYRGRGLSWVLMRSVLEDVAARHITVTSYCLVLDRFVEKNSEYAYLIDSGKSGNQAATHRAPQHD
ncbi:MAG TPA: GNAT family N-acetyltransferase [Trebonia sp.]